MWLIAPKSWTLAAIGAALVSVLALNFTGCDSGGRSTSKEFPASLGQAPAEDVPAVCTGCLTEEKIGQIVAVEGEIVQQCPAAGCWFRLKDEAGVAFVDLAPAKLSLKENRVGQHAKVTGRVVKTGGQFRLEAQHVAFGTDVNAAPGQKKE